MNKLPQPELLLQGRRARLFRTARLTVTLRSESHRTKRVETDAVSFRYLRGWWDPWCARWWAGIAR
jgi:hypothetical protein